MRKIVYLIIIIALTVMIIKFISAPPATCSKHLKDQLISVCKKMLNHGESEPKT